MAKKPEPEPESEDEELDVEEVVIGGKNYFKAEDGKIYNKDTQELVGENGELYQ
jgi:hypothetical protein